MMNTDSLRGQVSVKTSISGNTPGIKGEKGNGIESTILNDDYTLTLNYTNGTSDTTPSIRGEKGEKGDNGISPSITTTKSGKVTTITIEDATGTKTATINDGIDGQGDMLKSTYDKNSNGIVDNSEKVNGYTVETNVPSDAKFTDTIYTHPDTSGNKHIPSGGVSGQILKWDEDGTAKWDDSVEAHREGTELKINNYKGLIKFTKEGKSTQETRSGKNKFCLNKLNWITTSTSPILTINSDNSCVISKTNPVAYDVIRADITNFLEVGKTYIASANVSNKDYGQFVFDEYNGSTRVQSGKNKIKIIDGYTYYIKIYVNRTSSAYDGDLSITYTDMQIEEGITETSFEKYGASPSPDYPSEIISIPSVENLFDKDSVELGKVWNGSINTKRAYGYIEAIQGQEYTVSTKNTNSDLKIYIIESTSIGAIETPIVQNALKSTLTFTPKTTTKYIVVQFSTTTNDMIQTIVDNALVKIEKGTIAHPYVPFGNYLRIDNVGKNLFDKDNAIKGFYYDALGGLSPSENWYYENIRVKPNTSYSISGNTTNNTSAFFVELNKNLELVKIIGNYYNTHNFTTSNETYYVGVSIPWYGDSDGRNNINTFQVEKGSATEYEPYRNKVIYVNMQDKKLCSNKDETIKDKLIIYDNGKTEINKKIGEVILDGSESGWERGTSTSGNYYYQLNMENIKPAINNTSICNIKCSHFESKSANDIWAGIKGISVRVNISGFRFCYVNDKTDTLEKWKAYLQEQYYAGNPVKIQYELAEPETIDLGITDFNLLEGNSELTCEDESNMQLDYLTIDSNIFVQDSLDGNSSTKAPSLRAVNEIISQLEARIIELESKNV